MTNITNPWDQRYAAAEYVYGTTPNVFFKSHIDLLAPGKILMVAEGEGRNAVYAAQSGWQVIAFDSSKEGKKKAHKLAARKNVDIIYQVGELANLNFEPESFDAVGLIFAHFPAHQKTPYLQRVAHALKPGGFVIFEAYDKAQATYRKQHNSCGGPPDTDALYSVAELENIFSGLDIILLHDKDVDLQEGQLHRGLSRVVQYIGRKPN